MFERLVQVGNLTPLLLETQYRMHPSISAFPRATFYAGRIQDGSACLAVGSHARTSLAVSPVRGRKWLTALNVLSRPGAAYRFRASPIRITHT